MDNHKDFIHIDDVFKDLRNGEEQEPSGAWLRMKDLLDKEMPAGTTPVTAGRSFRRYIIPLAALLLAGGGFTYYKMNQDSKNAAILHSSGTVIAGNTSGSDKSGRMMSGNSDDVNHAAPASSNHATATHSATTKNNTANSSGNLSSSVTTPKESNNMLASGVKSNTTAGHTTYTSGNANRPSTTAHTAASNNATEAQKAENAGKTAGTPTAVIEHQRVIEEIKPKSSNTIANNTTAVVKNNTASAKGTANQSQPEDQYSSSNNNMKLIATTLNNKKIVETADGKLYKEERDTFKRIDVVARTVASGNNNRNNGQTKLDTVAITRVERISYVPLNVLEMVALRKIKVAGGSTRTVVPVASLKDKIVSNEMVSMVPLANYKVASRRVDPGKFNQLVQNTSQGISNYFDGSRNFYAAVLLGGNTSFGNPGAFGLQLGIAGLYQLNERLTLAAELKFVNHYFSNYSLEDESVTFENINSQQLSGAEWLFSGTQKTSTSAYKLNSFGALEMPITLNYNLGRVSVFGGLNMAYAFPVNWNKESSVNTVAVEKNSTQNQNPFLNSSFKIDEQNDFSSRFGLGYVWGLNYDFSRKVSLDARLTQILWDNNKGNTDAIKRLFHVPTLQISIGYFFGRKDKVVYIMDEKR